MSFTNQYEPEPPPPPWNYIELQYLKTETKCILQFLYTIKYKA